MWIIESLQEGTVDRCCYIYSEDDSTDYFLHGFCKSILVAYGACIYLKSTSRSGKIYVELVTV